jgi:hypothetical protein
MMSFATCAPLKLIIGSPSLRDKFQREIIPEMLESENMLQNPLDCLCLPTLHRPGRGAGRADKGGQGPWTLVSHDDI